MPSLVDTGANGDRCELRSATAMPHACTFLWNDHLLLQLNCRGFAVAQHMQPEPTRYSHAPVLEQQTFVQPEQPLYAHHPGRFVYVYDEESSELYSIPHDPVRNAADSFCFSAGKADVLWKTRHGDIETRLSVSLPVDEAVELWTFVVHNTGKETRRLKLFPSFTIGYMSWMNQSASYRPDLGGIVARSVTPYQRLEDHAHVESLKDLTVLLHDTVPTAWEASRDAFEGEGGIQSPDGVLSGELKNGDALYETPVATLQYDVELAAGESRQFRFVFGPARNDNEVRKLREKFLPEGGFAAMQNEYAAYLADGEGCLKISTPDNDLDSFVNHWLDRQVYYHGRSNRLTTDPQTRNYLQDGMGMVYIDPEFMRRAFLTTLSQQKPDGALPDGIVLTKGNELKYINQIPHTDHCVWLPVCLEAFLNETADMSLLDEMVDGLDDEQSLCVFDRVTNAMRWLIGNRDARGLSYIAQGDWCDPMNMVGHKGHGVSGWLTIATAHAVRLWSGISAAAGQNAIAEEMANAAEECTESAQAHLWDGHWFARGISDNGKAFGVSDDGEGTVFLNPQSWALMSGVATEAQRQGIYDAVRTHLDTPYGAMMLAPAYTAMRDDIGRVTQKHPGSAENGSIYNHAATFWVYALFCSGQHEMAYAELRKMLPGPSDEDYVRRGQFPVFLPNYYRGAVKQFPRTAGRSSQMFNTGAASWLYRIIIECLFGMRGTADGLSIRPALPAAWKNATAIRRFRGAQIETSIRRCRDAMTQTVSIDGKEIPDAILKDIIAGETYRIDVVIPETIQ